MKIEDLESLPLDVIEELIAEFKIKKKAKKERPKVIKVSQPVETHIKLQGHQYVTTAKTLKEALQPIASLLVPDLALRPTSNIRSTLVEILTLGLEVSTKFTDTKMLNRHLEQTVKADRNQLMNKVCTLATGIA